MPAGFQMPHGGGVGMMNRPFQMRMRNAMQGDHPRLAELFGTMAGQAQDPQRQARLQQLAAQFAGMGGMQAQPQVPPQNTWQFGIGGGTGASNPPGNVGGQGNQQQGVNSWQFGIGGGSGQSQGVGDVSGRIRQSLMQRQRQG